MVLSIPTMVGPEGRIRLIQFRILPDFLGQGMKRHYSPLPKYVFRDLGIVAAIKYLDPLTDFRWKPIERVTFHPASPFFTYASSPIISSVIFAY